MERIEDMTRSFQLEKAVTDAYNALRRCDTVTAYNILEKARGKETTVHADKPDQEHTQDALDALTGESGSHSQHRGDLLLVPEKAVEG